MICIDESLSADLLLFPQIGGQDPAPLSSPLHLEEKIQQGFVKYVSNTQSLGVILKLNPMFPIKLV